MRTRIIEITGNYFALEVLHGDQWARVDGGYNLNLLKNTAKKLSEINPSQTEEARVICIYENGRSLMSNDLIKPAYN